jgi:hypothetical protein
MTNKIKKKIELIKIANDFNKYNIRSNTTIFVVYQNIFYYNVNIFKA